MSLMSLNPKMMHCGVIYNKPYWQMMTRATCSNKQRFPAGPYMLTWSTYWLPSSTTILYSDGFGTL